MVTGYEIIKDFNNAIINIKKMEFIDRYESSTGTFTVPLVETDSITSLFIVYRYDSTTGTFTVPPGGRGFYYFSVYLQMEEAELGHFDLELNGQRLCTAHGDQQDTPGDEGQAACSATAFAIAGGCSKPFVESLVIFE